MEQVKKLARTIYSTSEKGSHHEDLADKIVEIANAALAAPLRNCDVGTADEQYRRHDKFCDDHFTPSRVGGHCHKCPLEEERGRRCTFFWIQMPYCEGGEK